MYLPSRSLRSRDGRRSIVDSRHCQNHKTKDVIELSEDERMTKLEHRVRELQTAVVAIVRHLGIEEHVAAAERARLDEIKAKGEVPDERLIELLSTPPHS